ncbi:MAG TPA: asparagine synthase (glutamine-hydrolyzing) [Anaerolineales bacterium]|nr:asparagine synthase (glutamine-hydrolyzing) [Anaerolineales bacterium]
MCGIFGVWNLRRQAFELDTILASLGSIRHRGPDDEGYLLVDTQTQKALPCSGRDSTTLLGHPRIEECITPQYDLLLGFRRLSIIDLSPAGHQPMGNAEGTVWIVFNGEIYNYIELRSELQSLGHAFHTQSDTEVILNAYEAWGTECLSRFNGMWAFTIYDLKKRRIFSARDRFGIKPFFYCFDRDRFMFASEIKALLSDPNIRRTPNDAVIYDYLAYGVLDHTEETFYQGIKQLPPAHYLILEDGDISMRRYWDIDPDNRFDVGEDDKAVQEYARRFFDIFEDAVRIHLRSDVPVGSCLSGGLDSSTIVMMANRLLLTGGAVAPEVIGDRQKTFSSCFDDARFDERKYIREIVAATSAESNYIFPSAQNLMEELPKLMKHQDEPFGSTSMYAQWCVMKLAGQHGMRVLLDGQGSDEMLAGYVPFFDAYWGLLTLRGDLAGVGREWSAYRKLRGVSPLHLLQHTLFALVPLGIQRQVRYNRGSRVLNPDFSYSHRHRFSDGDMNYSGGLLSDRLYLSTTRTSLPALLRYEDRSSMAYSIESRVPFLDYRLVEYVFSLPDHQKINNGYTKAVLRNSMRDVLPNSILSRSDKMGFVTPEHVWFDGELRSWADEIIHSESFRKRKYFNFPQVLKTMDEYRSRKRDIGFALWRWINLELWLQNTEKSGA